MSLDIVGNVSYRLSGGIAQVNIQRVEYDGSGVSGTIRLELWASTAPYSDGSINGYRLAEYVPVSNGGRLSSGQAFTNISFSDPYTLPSGRFYLTVFATEYTGASVNQGFSIRDSSSFADLIGGGGTPVDPDPEPDPDGARYIYGTWGDDSGPSINGTTGDDVIYGYAGNDTIFAFDGNNRIYGGAGDDELTGGFDRDRIFGDAGKDRIFGFEGNDQLSGGDGDDYILGGDGHDTVQGDAGNDYLSGMAGNDVISGGSGADSLWGDVGNDRLNGGSGNDDLSGGAGRDTLTGGSGHDDLWGGSGNDLMQGQAGRDTLFGGGGHDSLSGGAGNDWLVGSGGNDRFTGGSGNDILSGGAGRDRIQGDGGADMLTGGAGADRFIFLRVSDIVKSGDTSEKITDFSRSQGDIIDLSAIDANTRSGGNQAFDFIGGQRFSGDAGELRFKNGILQGDVNGDRRADFSLHVEDVGRLFASDFDL